MSYSQGYKPTNGRKPYAGNGNKKKPARGKSRKKRKGHPLRIFFTLVVLACLATGGVMFYMMYEEVGRVERADTFYPGVYVDGYSLSGATPQEAYDFLISRARDGMDDWAINLAYGDQSWTITTDTLGLGGVVESVVSEEINKAFYVGRMGSLIDRYKTILALKTEPYYGYTSGIEKNMAQIDSIISEIQASVYRAPVDAEIAFDATRRNPVVITEEVQGQQIDAAALKAQITDMVYRMEGGTIAIAPTPIPATRTADSLRGQIVLLGSCESAISTSSTENRNKNIERGCLAFNGKVINPGERVSFNTVVGKRTRENGFFEADEIVSGKYELGWGGGICQVSSTLYNAVVQANLKVRERRNHGIPVRYMDMGADATVADRGIDFVFENNTDAPLYMIARLDGSGSRKTCVVQIYGRPDPNGYTYSMRHETVEEIPIPSPTYVADKTQEYVTYKDQEKEISKGAKGYVVKTYLVVRNSSGVVIDDSKLLSTDTYNAQKPVIYVGTQNR